MIKLKDVPYKLDFYHDGIRYQQYIKPKNAIGNFAILCITAKVYPWREKWFHALDEVKPVIK